MALHLVHVPNLGFCPRAEDERVNLKIALKPWWRGITRDAGDFCGLTEATTEILSEASFLPPVNAPQWQHPAQKNLALRHNCTSAARAYRNSTVGIDQFTGAPDSLSALTHYRALTLRMVGRTNSLSEAKMKARACILQLHPDKRPGLVASPHGAQSNADTLLMAYTSIFKQLEHPRVGPYIAGHVAYTNREALDVCALAARQRFGKRGAYAIGTFVSASVLLACVGLVAGMYFVGALNYIVNSCIFFYCSTKYRVAPAAERYVTRITENERLGRAAGTTLTYCLSGAAIGLAVAGFPFGHP